MTSPFHSLQTANHKTENYTFADAAARAAGSGYTFAAADLGKIAYQTDTGSYWRLTATAPTWVQMGGPGLSGVPSGAAGGDLTGTYPNPTLAAAGAGAGTTGDASHTLAITLDAKGRVSAITNNSIAIAESQVTSLVSDLAAKEATANKGIAGGYASLDGSAKVPLAQLPAAIVGALQYQGTWNANTNSPTLVSSTGTLGFFYKVSVAGTTSIDGIADWGVGDWIVFDGTVWDKIDNTEAVSSVFGRTGAVTMAIGDLPVTSGNLVVGAAGIGSNLAPGSAGQVLKSNGTTPGYADDLTAITCVMNGAGSVLTAGLEADVTVPFNCTIVEATVLLDVSGSCVVAVWKDIFNNYPPTAGDNIAASAPPTVSSALGSRDSTLTGWTLSITAGDCIRFHLTSVTAATRITISLKVKKG